MEHGYPDPNIHNVKPESDLYNNPQVYDSKNTPNNGNGVNIKYEDLSALQLPTQTRSGRSSRAGSVVGSQAPSVARSVVSHATSLVGSSVGFVDSRPVKARKMQGSLYPSQKQLSKSRGLEYIQSRLQNDQVLHSKTIEEMLEMALEPIHVDFCFYQEFGGKYTELEDNAQEFESQIAQLQGNLAQIQHDMGKGAPTKVPEPKYPEPWLYEDLLAEMHDFQDLVADEHREKRRKYKLLVTAAQKLTLQNMQSRAKEQQDEFKARKVVCKNISGLILTFWQRIERLAWERLKQDLQAQLIEKKRQRLDKFVEDAIKLSIAKNERVKSTKKPKAPIEPQPEEDEFVPSNEMRQMEIDDLKLDHELEEAERGIDFKTEVSSLVAEAEAPLEEILRRYRDVDPQPDDPSSEASKHDDAEDPEDKIYQHHGEEEEESDTEGNFDVTHERYKRQEEQDELLDEAMSDAEDEDVNREGGAQRLIQDLEDEANLPIEELLARYKQQSDEVDSTVTSSAHEDSQDESLDEESGDDDDDQEVQVPSLIRATLRPYQLEGLRWLASLYKKGTNGILADEMGLGKTLQTICLLAHLACEHNNWGPHLIVVPTSVLLNWEIEFKKFCPGFNVLSYYGTPQERAKKRVGWNQPHSFNVCIVSYATVVQDAYIMKRKSWVYMVLDEAQNIKNFNSKRWQTLLTFNTFGRILLTGTPLQNSLQELWSLMHFILPEIFTSHSEFKEWFSDPLTETIEKDQIAGESGALNAATSELVKKLHTVFRPYLLRRLKKDVEKQMPSKYEHVIKCHLTRRQRVLYDEFISSRNAQDALVNPSYRGMLNVLIQLRKICNHPDQLEMRPVESPYFDANFIQDEPIPKMFILEPRLQGLDTFLIKPRINTKCTIETRLPMPLSLKPVSNNPCFNGYYKLLYKVPSRRAIGCSRSLKNPQRLSLTLAMQQSGAMLQKLLQTPRNNHSHPEEARAERNQERQRLDEIRFLTEIEREAVNSTWRELVAPTVDDLVQEHWEMLENFVCTVPRVQVVPRACGVILDPAPKFQDTGYRLAKGRNIEHVAGLQQLLFPSRRMLHEDCGKFLVLGDLLKRLRSQGSRCLVYTQFSKMLDILEKWINYQGFTYVRLDGSTKVDMRQRLVTRFNENDRIFLFISSTRAGGVGLSLTGADSVIFYDTDWNPAMDRQAMDRCHRIGQTREVNVYRLICEHTVEENIWRKQLQKRRLDDIVVDGGKFDVEHHNWFSNVDTLVGILQACRAAPGATSTSDVKEEDIYGRHTLHESQPVEPTMTLAAPIAKHAKLLGQVEDVDDIVIVGKPGKERQDQTEDFGVETKTDLTVPALVSYSVGFVCKYQTPTLVAQVEEMKIRIQAEDINSDQDLEEDQSASDQDEEDDSLRASPRQHSN
ncbi:bifunctional P-loop containing nucleoside triphosphate hydrolase/Helicase superfamily 1-2 [Babesia duncani]|uniref:Bifunctional P-loop containing nucleoside triphosphate hydrolase/Helicase superfamily 1-2 n=1 Tax=Babesia duncani TaxID=323732 RepID=A0AAD9PMN6_9APIC|nr:bifunctional P-loop containing nucleoside triphosphate hydrolase/Helicase superfamily 1-2 [Babesia duncani]